MDRNHDSLHDDHAHGDHDHDHGETAVTASGGDRRHFMSVEELRGDASVEAARIQELSKPPVQGDGSEVERRDFMKVLGVTFAAAGLTASCARLPEKHIIPYAHKPEELTPGMAVYFATTCSGCSAGCGVLMKSREGRPIKVEGNPEHPLSQGGVCAIGQASVLNVYDGDRLKKPKVGGADSDWKAVDAAAALALAPYKQDGSKLAVVTPRVTGPAASAALAGFLAQFPGVRHAVYEPAQLSAIGAAHALSHGRRIVPGYQFDKAEVVVSLGADFQGTWLQPVAFTKQWSRQRKLTAERKTMGKLFVAETNLSLTGTNADERLRMLPGEERALAFGLASRIAKATGFTGNVPTVATDKAKALDVWAKALMAAKGKSLVVSGSADLAVQAAVNLINEQLGNYGKTLDMNTPLQVGGDQALLDQCVADLKSGALTGVVLWNVNPVYESAHAADWTAGIQHAAVSIALTHRADETAQLCKIVAAAHHPLEAWSDGEPVLGLVNMRQPLVRPLFDTRGAEDTLLAWSGSQETMLPFIKTTWQRFVFPRSSDKTGDFQTFWDKTVQDGFAIVSRQTAVPRAGGPAEEAAPQPVAGPVAVAAEASPTALPAEVSAVALPVSATPVEVPVELVSPPPSRFDAAGIAKAMATAAPQVAGTGAFDLVLYHTVALGTGEHANNPFLQELPDPVTKATWGNYACISPAAAKKLGVGSHDVVKVVAGSVSVELPVCLAPGLHDGAIALALGYGRKAAGRIGNGLGVDVTPFSALGPLVKCDVQKTGRTETVAFSQTHHSYEHRDIVRETTLPDWQKDHAAGNEALSEMLRDTKVQPTSVFGERQTRSLWDRHKFPTYRWGMAIDLNSCTGCGACVLACNIENNIPVVGKSEVILRREMHWLRLDRYFSERKPLPRGEHDWDPTEDDLLALADNPEVVHQPMLCQHCENAPCETVCPVLATVHTSEGLNAQVYNRCIGTRYCANNCPYKVRRFNWFSYPHGEMAGKQDVDLVALALNPDIVKRSRGVMEKCSFCVQRIQDAKSEAVRENRELVRDGDVQTACQQTCPADAITFGNLNDDKSAVRKAFEDPRNYSALGEIGVQPVVSYQTKVRNAARADAGAASTEG